MIGSDGVRWVEGTLRQRPRYQRAGAALLGLTLLLVALQLLTSSDLPPLDSELAVGTGKYTYDSKSPLIFIGGFPRSGTTLMRAMLDAHPDIRCGQETRVLPRILTLITGFSKLEKSRMHEGGVTKEILDKAVMGFLLHIIVSHGETAKRLCTKDPFLLSYSQYLHTLFPNSKFILMVRDGRAAIYSSITRNVTITGMDSSDPAASLGKWSRAVGLMHRQCVRLGPRRCVTVHYEQLVLHPARCLAHILAFLAVPWDDAVMHHESEIDRPGGVKISRHEKSSDQIIKPVNVGALTKWVGFYDDDVVANMSQIAPMLSKLGYDPNDNPPNYGTPDSFVLKNTELIQKQVDFWKRQVIKMGLNKKPIIN